MKRIQTNTKMVKKLVTLFIFTVVGQIVFGQDTASRKVFVHSSEMGLKGSVKTYKITPYKVNEYFGEIQKGGKQDFWNGDVVTVFDEKGYKTETNRHNKTGQLFQKIIYKYNEKGNRLSRDVYNAFGKILLKNTYVYDDSGNKLAYNSYKPTGELIESFTYKNDNKGRMIEETLTKADKTFQMRYTYKYDAAGFTSEVAQYVNEANNLNNSIRFKNNRQGLPLEMENYNKSGSLIRKTTYKYDDKGNEILIEIFDGQGKSLERKEFTYTFDDKGNWVERIEYVNHFPKVFIEREITYY